MVKVRGELTRDGLFGALAYYLLLIAYYWRGHVAESSLKHQMERCIFYSESGDIIG